MQYMRCLQLSIIQHRGCTLKPNPKTLAVFIPILFLIPLIVVLIQNYFVNGTCFSNSACTTTIPSFSFQTALFPLVGSASGYLPLFITVAVLGLAVCFLSRRQTLTETPSSRLTIYGSVAIVAVSCFVFVFLNLYQSYSNNWFPTGWDTSDLLWQPKLYSVHNVYNLLHFQFPLNPIAPSALGGNGFGKSAIDTNPFLLMVLQGLYSFVSNFLGDLYVIDVVNVAIGVGLIVSIFLLARRITHDTLLASISTAIFSIGLGFYELSWGSTQNFFAVVLINFGLYFSLSKTRLKYVTIPLFTLAIFTHDVGIIFVGSIFIFLCFLKLPSFIKGVDRRVTIQHLLLYLIPILIMSPFEIVLLGNRGSFISVAGIASQTYQLTTWDFLASTGGVILLGLLGLLIAIRYGKDDWGIQTILAYFLSGFVLTLPWFFDVQFRFLWMLQIPLSILAIFIFLPFGSYKNFRLIVLVCVFVLLGVQTVFTTNFIIATHENAGNFCFPGSCFSLGNYQAADYMLSFDPNRTQVLVLSPNQFAGWIFAETGYHVSYMTGANESDIISWVHQWQPRFTGIYIYSYGTQDLTTAGADHGILLYNQSGNYVFNMTTS